MEDIQTEQSQTSPIIEPIRFRAGKKRKAYRQRATEEDEANDGVTTATSPAPVMPGVSSNLKDVDPGRDADDTGAEAQNPTEGDSEMEVNNENGDDDGDDQTTEESAVAAALRLRNARRAASRRGGVGFRSEGRSANGEDDSEHALVLRDQDKEVAAAQDRIVGGITNRFMHQTGLLTILDDSHMYVSEAPLCFLHSPSKSSNSLLLHFFFSFPFLQSAELIIQECIHRIPFS